MMRKESSAGTIPATGQQKLIHKSSNLLDPVDISTMFYAPKGYHWQCSGQLPGFVPSKHINSLENGPDR